MKHQLLAIMTILAAVGLLGCTENNLLNESQLLQGDEMENGSGQKGNIDLKINPDIQDTLVPQKKYYMEEDKEMSGRICGFDFILEITDVSERRGIDIKINSKKLSGLRIGQFVEVEDDLVLNIEDALFNDPGEKGNSLVFFSFENRTIEHYPDWLIEEDIEDFYYIQSTMDVMNASYDNSLTRLREYKAEYEGLSVKVISADRDYLRSYFSLRYPDRSSLREVMFNEYIIVQGGTSFSSWLSKSAVVEIRVNDSMGLEDVEPVIKAYLDEYPTLLTEDYNCIDRIILEEKATVRIETDRDYEILNYAVSDQDGRVKLKVDGEFIGMLELGEYFVLGETPVTVDKVEIFEDGEPDYVEFCVG